MPKLVIGEANELSVEQVIANLPHALILSAPDYQWGELIAQHIAQSTDKTYEIIYPIKYDKIDTEIGKVTITQIRQLIGRTRTQQEKGRIYIIYMADSMTAQAQNAFLKALEEPNPTTYFILLVKNRHSLIPTVLSRAQNLNIKPLKDSQIVQLLPDTVDATLKKQIIFIANGNPVALNALLENPGNIKQYSDTIAQAKILLTGTIYQKIVLINQLKKTRPEAILVLDSLIKILKASIKTADKKQLGYLDSAVAARKDIISNHNVSIAMLYHLV